MEGVGLLVIASVMTTLMDTMMKLSAVNYRGGGGDGVMDSVKLNRLKRLGDGAVRAVVMRGTEVVSRRVGGGGEGGTWTQTDKTRINFTICCCKIPLCSGHLAARKTHFVLNISSSFIVYIVYLLH